jgi:hypothetical protein
VLQDNEVAYFSHLEGLIDSIDELSSMEIIKTPSSYHFRIATSIPQYNELLLQELLKFHNIFKIKMDMSKSIKASATIVFQIELI